MWSQIAAIVWAQFRVSRNHLPRTSWGTILSWSFSLIWYGLYTLLAVFLAVKLPDVPVHQLMHWLPAGLLGVFLFWQVIPLFTLSSGWSLQLNKLQIYPVRNNALFGIETLLRLTSAPEMVIVLLGTMIGLFRHAALSPLCPLFLLAYIPLNLFCQLGVRDLILHSFERNRFRELFAVLIIGLGVLPQLLFRTGLGQSLKPYFFRLARSLAAPWYTTASLALGRIALLPLLLLLLWLILSFLFARWMFAKSLVEDDSFQLSAARSSDKPSLLRKFSSWPSRIFPDPLAALLQKELQSLIRMPRFRVLFGMACLLGIVVFIPATIGNQDSGSTFIRSNLIPVVNLYGLLLLSDTLLLNAFGLDRAAAQIFFVTPISLQAVVLAKNLTAVVFVLLQSLIIVAVAAVARATITPFSVGSGILASAVVTLFLLTVGNYTSLAMARPIDPKQTFKKQAGARMQFWLLACSFGLFLLVGFAFLARYATHSNLVFMGVLCLELLIGLVVYRIGLASAVRRGIRDRETIITMLSKNASPVNLD